MLKQPLAVGTTWRGEHGGTTRILSIAASVEVPRAISEGCVQTLEERLGDRPVKYATTFCPGVGVVMLEAASGASLERASLKSYAAPIEVGLDGVDRFQTKPADPAAPLADQRASSLNSALPRGQPLSTALPPGGDLPRTPPLPAIFVRARRAVSAHALRRRITCAATLRNTRTTRRARASLSAEGSRLGAPIAIGEHSVSTGDHRT